MESQEHRFLTDRMVVGLWGQMNRRDAAFANSMAIKTSRQVSLPV